MTHALFLPVRLGDLALKNRILMSPMTRARVATRIPTDSTVTYYTQRAGAGLILTEATTVSQQGDGSLATPGIYTAKQISGWKRVTDSVREAGGTILCQLWHAGRVSHSCFQENNAAPVSASHVHGEVRTFTPDGFERTSKPRALTSEEIPAIVEQFAQGARSAIEAGFDGVEVHSASGYLLDQFLRDGTNRRTDAYGGSIENRCRFTLDIVDAVAAAVGEGRTAIRISPMVITWDCADSNPVALFRYLVRELDKRNLAFLDVMERNDMQTPNSSDVQQLEDGVREIRSAFTGNYVANGGFAVDTAKIAIETDHAVGICFGRDYISTPDLAERMAAGAELNPPADPLQYYGDGGDAGYLDYPSMND